jgi:TonB-linked SusC/RagA family outer membrane protein
MMKLTIALLIVGLVQVSAKSNAQLITLQEKNISVEKVLLLIEKQSGYHFIYDDNLDILKSRTLSINVEKQTIANVLDQCLNGIPVSYKIFKKTIALKGIVPLPNEKPVITVQKIIGTVTDDKGAPLVGASVMVKDAKKGTVTNAAGEFSIDAKPGDVLIVSFVGFQTREIVIGSQSNIEVRLTAFTNSLNELVVIGYGTQKLSNITGAISSIKASDMKDQQITRLDNALQGRVPGVTVVQNSGAPGSGPNVLIRGVTSINSSSPLYVIDGIVVDNGGLDNINPSDITSIEVLKDASAAIYGSRSSAGVVIVTTKKGKPGPSVLTYDGSYGLQNPVKKVQMTNATQYETVRNQAVTNDGGTAPFANPAGAGTGTNWQDVIFGKNVPIQNHNISVSGGTDKSTYYTSFGYLDQQGLIMPSVANYKRANFTVNTSSKIVNWLTIGENLSLAYGKSVLGMDANGNNNSGPLTSAVMLDPLTPVVVTDINSQPNAAVYNNPNYAPYLEYDPQGHPYGISNYVQKAASNPLAYVQTQQGYNWQTNILGSAFVELRPITGLTIRSQISTKVAYYGNRSFTPLYFLSLGDNNLTINHQYEESDRNITINWDNTATYTRTFGLHDFSLLVGTNMQNENGHGLNGTFYGEPVNSFSQASTNFGLANINKIAGGYDTQPYRVASIFGRLLYNYDQKYLLNVTVRRDGSSKFGTNNIFGVFPSAEAGYVVSKEKFFPNDGFVNFLKLRASYGVLGNEQSLGVFQYTTTIDGGRNALFGDNIVTLGSNPGGLANPNLKWEQVKMSNIGFDAIVFKYFNVSFDAYHKVLSGMLDNPQLPGYVGATADPYINVGDMLNRGLELSINYSRKLGQVSLNAGGNIAYNQNKILSLTRYKTYGGIGGGSNLEIQRTAVGQSYQAFYGYQELGVFHSQNEINAYTNSSGGLIQPNAKPGDFKWADLNGDGTISTDDRKFLGRSTPPFTYGINLSATYKQFDLRMFGQGAWGNMIAQDYRRLDYPGSNYQIAAINAWTPANSSSNYPRLTDNDPNGNFKNFSNFYLQSGAYFRIKNLLLGYTLSQGLIKSANIKNVRIYAGVNNLATITKYNGYDPEINGGIDYAVYPQARTFILGLNVSL